MIIYTDDCSFSYKTIFVATLALVDQLCCLNHMVTPMCVCVFILLIVCVCVCVYIVLGTFTCVS